MGLRVFLNAVVFCMLNGYLQSSYLMYHAKFGKDWLFRINVLVGEISSFLFCFENLFFRKFKVNLIHN